MSMRQRIRKWIGVARRVDGEVASNDVADQTVDVAAIEAKLGYDFDDPTLLGQALIHRSHTHVAGVHRRESNERLEFLGDAVLELVVNEYLYRLYPSAEEGELTQLKSQLVCGTSLSGVASGLDIGAHILMSRGEAATGGRQRSSILADTVEAIIGAVYLDGGLDAARQVIRRWVLSEADRLADDEALVNHKSRLQEVIQARFKAPPRYRVRGVEGPDHDRIFTIEVMFQGRILGAGVGPNKKMAEQVAAGDALARLEADPDILDREL